MKADIGILLAIGMSLNLTGHVAGDCASLTNCSACANTTSCHWCSDGKCHKYGSVYGCLNGVSCYDNQACVRKHPQVMPRKPPSFGLVVALAVFLISALFCTGACYWVVNEYIDHATITRIVKESGYQELVTLEEDKNDRGERSGDPFAYRLMRAESAAGDWDPVPRVTITERSKFISALLWLTRIGVVMVGIFLLFVVMGVIFYAPHVPEINVCNNELDWNSLIKGATTLKLEADEQILLSVYNPNRLDVSITSGSGVFKHNFEPIGTVEFPKFTIKGGAITDVLVTLVFTPSVWNALALEAEFMQKMLMIMVDLSVGGLVTLNGIPVLPFSYTLNNYFIHVGEAGARNLCQCPGW